MAMAMAMYALFFDQMFKMMHDELWPQMHREISIWMEMISKV